MNWIKGKLSTFANVQEKTKFSSVLNLTPRTHKPKPFEDYDIEYLSTDVIGSVTKEVVKQNLLLFQKQYDKSNEVNAFYINGIKLWLDDNTRMSILVDCDIPENIIIPLWINGIKFEIKNDDLKKLIIRIKQYASQTYNTTQDHLVEINKLKELDDLYMYDITLNYPSPIKCTLDSNGNIKYLD